MFSGIHSTLMVGVLGHFAMGMSVMVGIYRILFNQLGQISRMLDDVFLIV
jgi:hypothetical protein